MVFWSPLGFSLNVRPQETCTPTPSSARFRNTNYPRRHSYSFYQLVQRPRVEICETKTTKRSGAKRAGSFRLMTTVIKRMRNGGWRNTRSHCRPINSAIDRSPCTRLWFIVNMADARAPARKLPPKHDATAKTDLFPAIIFRLLVRALGAGARILRGRRERQGNGQTGTRDTSL